MLMSILNLLIPKYMNLKLFHQGIFQNHPKNFYASMGLKFKFYEQFFQSH